MKHQILLIAFLSTSLQVQGQHIMKTKNLLRGLIQVKYEVLKQNKHIKDGSYQYFFGGYLLTEGQFKQGKKTGLWKFHSPDRKLSFMGNYMNNAKVGRWLYVYQGAEVADIIYSGANQIRERYSLFPNGDTEFVWQRYYDGKDTLISHTRYLSSGGVKYTGTSTNGTFRDTTFYRNGQMEMILSYDKPSDKNVLTYLDSLGRPLPVDSALLMQINRHGYNAVVGIMPTFPGGGKVLAAYLSNAVEYPASEKHNRAHGIVKVRFVIDEEGYVGDIKVIQSVDRSLDAAAIKSVEEMPRWSPGMQNALPVKVQYVLPIRFHL